jgi:predicted ATPase
VHGLRGEGRAAQEQGEEAIALAHAQGFPQHVSVGRLVRGWGLALQGQEEGIAELRQAMAARRAMGIVGFRTWEMAILAEAYGRSGDLDAGLATLAEARVIADQTGEGFWVPELYRLQGEFLLARSTDQATQAETWLHQALEVARHQQAKSWELRAAMSLARLWQQQGKQAAAYELLAPIYGWFTEGFDTPDLQEARALLDALS